MMAYFAAGANKEAQREALKGCPVEWQELVKKHIEIRKQKLAHKVK